MHLALITTEFPPGPHGGTGASLADLARSMAQLGHQVTVLVLASSRRGEPPAEPTGNEGVHVIRLGARFPLLRYRSESLLRRWLLRRAIVRLHARSPVSVVEASDYEGWLPAGLPRPIGRAVRIRGSNLYFDSLLGRPGDAWTHRLERNALRRADALTSVSRFAGEETLRLANLDRPFEVLPNAVDTERFRPPAPGERVPGRILFVGSTGPKKGLRELVAAFTVLVREFPDLSLHCVGPESGLSQAELLDRIPPDTAGRIAFEGAVPRARVAELLRTASFCCMPSHLETFGIAALEAMACARPLIFTSTGPGPELLRDGEEGLLCDPHDPVAIAAALRRFILNPEYAARLGMAARSRVERDFALGAWPRRNEAYYTAVAARTV